MTSEHRVGDEFLQNPGAGSKGISPVAAMLLRPTSVDAYREFTNFGKIGADVVPCELPGVKRLNHLSAILRAE